MKATKLTIGFREWSKLPDFVEMINEEDEMVAYEIDNTTALLVAVGECGLAWIEAQAAQWYEDYCKQITPCNNNVIDSRAGQYGAIILI